MALGALHPFLGGPAHSAWPREDRSASSPGPGGDGGHNGKDLARFIAATNTVYFVVCHFVHGLHKQSCHQGPLHLSSPYSLPRLSTGSALSRLIVSHLIRGSDTWPLFTHSCWSCAGRVFSHQPTDGYRRPWAGSCWASSRPRANKMAGLLAGDWDALGYR